MADLDREVFAWGDDVPPLSCADLAGGLTRCTEFDCQRVPREPFNVDSKRSLRRHFPGMIQNRDDWCPYDLITRSGDEGRIE
jgi:hypothetical protein